MSENEQTKICPHCAEAIKTTAKVCPHCRYWQKKWSLYNPQIAGGAGIIIGFAILCGFGMFYDRMFGPKQRFAEYRDQIAVVSSEISWRVSGSESNVYVTVSGMLTNHSDVAWKDVGVEARFFDQSNKQFDAITVNTDGYRSVVILPHGEAAFRIESKAARPGADYHTYKVTVRWAKDVDQIF
jgi:hypothetical protein